MTARLCRLTLAIPVVAATILAACSSSTSNSNPKPTANVTMVAGAFNKGAQAFKPDTFPVSIAAGGKVTWRNDDGITHTATADLTADSLAGFHTNNLASGDTLTIDFSGFAVNDTIHYHCSIHNSMVGVIIVNP
ncbi:MAG: hypothetical protein ABI742_10725 [Gemmatimonadota bacterium]